MEHLNAKLQAFLVELEGLKNKLAAEGFTATPATARAALADVTAAYVRQSPDGVATLDELIKNGNDGPPVPVRLYLPGGYEETGLPLTVFVHGGGHMCGSIAVYDKIARKIAAVTGGVVMAPDYSLAPEFPYPAAIGDCVAVLRGAAEVLQRRGVKTGNGEITLVGDSGGGALCASLCMSEENIREFRIGKLLLIYPSLDYTLSSPSIEKFASGYFLEKSRILWYFDNYFRHGEDRRAASPLHNPLPSNMPRTQIIYSDHDPLSGEALMYYEKLCAAGAQAEILESGGTVHAYLMLEDLCPEQCRQTYAAAGGFIRRK